MIQENSYTEKKISDYEDFFGGYQMYQLRENSKNLLQRSVTHISSNFLQNNVGETLSSLISLENSLGIKSRWFSIAENDGSFAAKKMTNSLLGLGKKLNAKEKKSFISFNADIASSIMDLKTDVVVLHDPQFLPLVGFLKNTPIIFRLNMDLRYSILDSFKFMYPFLEKCCLILSNSSHYIPSAMQQNRIMSEKIIISPLGIDPLSDKNKSISVEDAKGVLESFDINTQKPIISQISHSNSIDKDDNIFEVIKNNVPNTQLVLSSSLIENGYGQGEFDNRAEDMYRTRASHRENFNDVPYDFFVNCLKTCSSIILENPQGGLSLSLTESMWKERPVIAKNQAYYMDQIKNNFNGFIVKDYRDAIEKSRIVLEHKDLSEKIGRHAKETVSKNFLVTRLLEDEVNYINLALDQVKPIQVQKILGAQDL